MKVLAISGSLRSGSYNTQLLRAAEELLSPEVDFVLYQGLKAVPPYDQDDDVQPASPAVAALRGAVAEQRVVAGAASLGTAGGHGSTDRQVRGPGRARA